MYVKPAKGQYVIFPTTGIVLPPSGAEVPDSSSYWQRLVAAGTVYVVTPDPTLSAGTGTTTTTTGGTGGTTTTVSGGTGGTTTTVSGGTGGTTTTTGTPGAAGAAGASFLSGTANPTSAIGADGDTYVNLSNGEVWKRTAGTWTDTGKSLEPAATSGTGTAGASFRYGTGNPAAGLGSAGDEYLNLTNGEVWTNNAGTWTDSGVTLRGTPGAPGTPGTAGAPGTPGTAGAAGANFLSGNGAPSASAGNSGDTYLDETTGEVWKRGASAWSDQSYSLHGAGGTAGAAGTNFRAGSGAPVSTLGGNGDEYMDRTTGELWTKANGAWVDTGLSVRGPAGTGGTGTAGPTYTGGAGVVISTAGAISTSIAAPVNQVVAAAGPGDPTADIVRFTAANAAYTIPLGAPNHILSFVNESVGPITVAFTSLSGNVNLTLQSHQGYQLQMPPAYQAWRILAPIGLGSGSGPVRNHYTASGTLTVDDISYIDATTDVIMALATPPDATTYHVQRMICRGAGKVAVSTPLFNIGANGLPTPAGNTALPQQQQGAILDFVMDNGYWSLG